MNFEEYMVIASKKNWCAKWSTKLVEKPSTKRTGGWRSWRSSI